MYRHIPTAFLFAFLVRILITGASVQDALALLGFTALFAFSEYLHHKKEPEVNVELKNKVSDLEEQLRIVRDKVNGISIAATFKR